ncbi:hypothetical protein ANANG_G00053980 [Anguilla anguilla]|uniref:Uncharacterized protein n=1 Tax=Anguilla anguilla TaxID=7936 RepID=A0A9D3MMZ5_ANGAN|nr:hypothetical protein ANANG_G00053980 [Anguilla anguilla]
MTLRKAVHLSGGERERHELPVQSASPCTRTRAHAQEDLRTLRVEEGVYFCASVWRSERGTPGETAVDAECLHQPEQRSLPPLLPPRSSQRDSGYRESRLPQIASVEPAEAEDTAGPRISASHQHK